MKNKISLDIKGILPYAISFLCGILFFLIILKIQGYEEVKAYQEVEQKIAIVNQDVVGDEYDFSFGEKVIGMLPEDEEYEFILTNYQDALEGVKGYAYSGYILIGSNFTTSIYSINDEIPTKGKISYKINPNLDEDQKKYVEDYILNQIYLINNNINYLYISSILEVLHGSQKNVEDVLKNEEEVDGILENIDNYNSQYYESSSEFLESPDNGSSGEGDLSMEIDPSSLIDFQFDAAAIKNLSSGTSSKYKSELEDNINALSNIYSDYGKMIIDNNVDYSQIEFDDKYLNYLNSGKEKIKKTNDMIKVSHSVYEIADSFDITQYENIVKGIDELYEDTIPDESGKGDVAHFSETLSSLKGDYDEVIIDFYTNYHYWTTNKDKTCPNLKRLPKDKTKYNCMGEFKVKYKDSKFVKEYAKYKSLYMGLVKLVQSDEYGKFIKRYDEYTKYLGDSNYTNYMGESEFKDLKEAYNKTDEFCKGESDNNNLIIGFSCSWEDNLSVLLSDQISIEENTKKEILNELVLQDVEVVQLMADREKKVIDHYMSTYPDLKEAAASGVENVVSEEAVDGLEENINSIQETNKNLEKTVYDNQFNTQENINTITKEFKLRYPELDTGLEENSELLYDFATLFENSNNAEGANYFLYDFVSNPIDIDRESDSERLIPIERAVNRDKVIILMGLLIGMIASYFLYYFMKKKFKDNSNE